MYGCTHSQGFNLGQALVPGGQFVNDIQTKEEGRLKNCPILQTMNTKMWTRGREGAEIVKILRMLFLKCPLHCFKRAEEYILIYHDFEVKMLK